MAVKEKYQDFNMAKLVSTQQFPRYDESVGRDDQGNYYNTPNKIRLPSVSRALKEFFPESEKSIQAWRKRVGEAEADRISATARNRGSSLHTLIEKYIHRQTDVGKVMPSTMSLFKQMYPILDKMITDVYLVEAPIWSYRYNLAGFVDTVGLYDNVLSTIDYKNSIKPKRYDWIENYFLQTTAYSLMIEEVYGTVITQNVIIIGVVESATPQIFFNDPQKMRNHKFFTERDKENENVN